MDVVKIEEAIRAFKWESYRLWECDETLSDDDTSRHEWVRDLAREIATAISE